MSEYRAPDVPVLGDGIERPTTSCAAIIFDMDGVLIDSEEHWDAARRALVAAHGGSYHDGVAADVMGMSPPEWSHYCENPSAFRSMRPRFGAR